eukprot:3556783-Karenia_brevis.AAC.1
MISFDWNEYIEQQKQKKGKSEEEIEEINFNRIFKSTHKPFDPDALLVFYNDEPMCIAHKDD